YAAAQPGDKSIDVLEMLLAPQLVERAGPDRSAGCTDVVLSLLRVIVAQNRDAAVVCAGLPADYRRLVGDALAPHGATTACDDLMLRTVDPVCLLQRLAPVLAARLRAGRDVVPLAVRIGPLRGGAVLGVGPDSVVVECPHRDDEHVLPEATFLALLLGTEDAREP